MKTRSVDHGNDIAHKQPEQPSRFSVTGRKSLNAINTSIFHESFSQLGNGDATVSPVAALVTKLEQASEDLVTNTNSVELHGFDMKMVSDTAEEYNRRREEVRRLVRDPAHFDESGRTDLNLDRAAIAGAKLLIDETRATRSMCRILTDKCGLEEEEFLYGGLAGGKREAISARELSELRQSSVMESLVDFHKQMKFKMTVLDYVANQYSKSNPRHGARGDGGPRAALAKAPVKKPPKNNVLKTPPGAALHRLNPLDDKRVIDSYALEVASEVTQRAKRRKIAGIPFNIDLLDTDDVDLNNK